MKGIAGFVVAAVLVALAGAVCMGIARFERNMASAEEDLATLRYADAAEKLSSASAYAEYTGWLRSPISTRWQTTFAGPVSPPFRRENPSWLKASEPAHRLPRKRAVPHRS